MKLRSILLLLPAALVFSSSFGQYKVTTNGQKYVLVEESTGPGCGYCPDGAQDIEQAIEPVYPHAVIASWHDSYYDGTSMVVPGNPFSGPSSSGGTGYITGDPEAAIDRYPFGGGSIGQNRPWESYVSTRLSTSPNFDVTLKSIYNPTTKLLTVTLTAKALAALTGKWNVNIFLTEDSLSSAGSGFQQHSYMYDASYGPCCDGSPCWFTGLCASSCGGGCSSCAFLPAANYSHMNVVRAVLSSTGSIFGDTAFTNPASGATYTKTYTYTIDTTKYVPKSMKVIGMVQKPGPASNTTGNIIENVIQAKIRLMPASLQATGEAEIVKTMTQISLFPNPAKNRITVRGVLDEPSATTIEIYNSTGQLVVSRNYPAGGSNFGEVIDLNNMSNGEYFMNITNNGEKVTKNFVISK